MKSKLNLEFEIISVARDGGSTLFYFRGHAYFLDYGINSPTRGVIFHGTDRTGLPVNQELKEQIKPNFLTREIK